MNEETKQILTNQLTIMRFLCGKADKFELQEREAWTLNFLHPKQDKKTQEGFLQGHKDALEVKDE